MNATPSRSERAEAVMNDPRWHALVARSADAAPAFLYSVASTGIYCRPGCPSRTPRPDNVRFHASAAEAERAGLRPCKRCKPQTQADARARLDYAVGRCSLGAVLVAGGPNGLAAILFGDDEAAARAELAARYPQARRVDAQAQLDATLARVIAHVEDPAAHADLALDPGGTPFQRAVWDALREVPAGATASYADIARRIGMPTAARAVAQACGANPLAVVVPCHRIVRADGGLSGYHWGVERKRALLAREARA